MLIVLYQCLMLSCQTAFSQELKQTADQGPVGRSRDLVQTVRSECSVRTRRSLRSILPLQHAHWGCWLKVLQPDRLLLQQLDNLRNFLDLCPHPQLCIFFKSINILMFNSSSSLLSRGGSSFLEKRFTLLHYIYPETVYSCRARNQSGAGPAWCGCRAHHSFMDPNWEDRMTPDRPRKCPCPPNPPRPPRFINKHTGQSGGDAVRLNRVSQRPVIGRTETLAEQILLPHFSTGQIFDRLQFVCLLCWCFGVCVLCGQVKGG